MKDKQIVIFGCGGHSRSVTDVLFLISKNLSIIFVDDNAKEGETLFGFPVLKATDLTGLPLFIGIGDNYKRKEKYELLQSELLISIYSPNAHIGKETHIGKGVFIGHFVHVGAQAKIGNNAILNTGSNVEHETVIGNHCHIAAGATVCGRCNLGNQVLIGAGAVVKDSITICSDVIIGAGAVVVKDITVPGVYIGCPAKLLTNSFLQKL